MKKFLCILLSAVLLFGTAVVASADKNSLILGDADLDSAVTILDATRIQRAVADLDTLNEQATLAADVDLDEEVTIIDATRIQRHVAELCNIDGSAPFDPARPYTYITDPGTQPESIDLNASEITLYPGESFQLSYTLNEGASCGVAYSVDDRQIASVSADGLIYAKASGSAVVTAATVNGLTATCKVNIKDKAASLSLPLQHLNLPVNGKFNLEAYAEPEDYSGKLTWTSSDTGIATVSGNQLKATVTAKKTGKATVTVAAEDGASASCTVNVTKTKATDSLKNQINSMPLYPVKTGIVALDNKVESVFKKIFKSGYTTYDKVKAVYDYEIATYSYAYTSLTESQQNEFFNNPDNRQLASSYDMTIAEWAYETMVTGKGVCYNYAAVFTVMMRAIGLECFSVEGDSTYADGSWGVHKWNIMLINGNFLLFDAQVDDNIHNNLGYTLYDRFGMSASDSTTDYRYSTKNRLEDTSRFNYFAAAPQDDFSVSVLLSGGGRIWSADCTVPADDYFASLSFDTEGYEGPLKYSIRVTSGSGAYMLYGDAENYDSSRVYRIDRFEGTLEDDWYYELNLTDANSYKELTIYVE